MTEKRYPELEQLFGAYFHQDWDLEGPDDQAILARYLEESSETDLQQAIAELQRLLDEPMEENELGDFLLRELGSYYYPMAEGKSYREWLEEVLSVLQAAS
jgi:hypothetical protein